MGLIDVARLEGQPGEELAREFGSTTPFPHIVLEGFLTDERGEVERGFPGPSWSGWVDRHGRFQPGKWSCRDIDVMPAPLRNLYAELSGPRFLRALSRLVSIEDLLPDPFLEGAGLQYTEPGGELMPHTDVRHHPRLQFYRRVNVLFYLNRGWEEGDGGELVLFGVDGDRPQVVVAPRFGTCVIFAADHRSVHAVAPLSADAQPRRSVAAWYYTVDQAPTYGGDRHIYSMSTRSGDCHSYQEWLRVTAMRRVLGASRTLNRMAARLDPVVPASAPSTRSTRSPLPV